MTFQDGEQVVGGDVEASPYDVDFRKTVFISGPHHELSGLIEYMHTALLWWSWCVPRLQEICNLFPLKFSKRRLLETCFKWPRPTYVYRDEITKFYALVYEKRWGTVSAATVKLSQLRMVIRQAWDKDAYSQGRDMAENADENDQSSRGSVQVERADEGIRSSFSGGTWK